MVYRSWGIERRLRPSISSFALVFFFFKADIFGLRVLFQKIKVVVQCCHRHCRLVTSLAVAGVVPAASVRDSDEWRCVARPSTGQERVVRLPASTSTAAARTSLGGGKGPAAPAVQPPRGDGAHGHGDEARACARGGARTGTRRIRGQALGIRVPSAAATAAVAILKTPSSKKTKTPL